MRVDFGFRSAGGELAVSFDSRAGLAGFVHSGPSGNVKLNVRTGELEMRIETVRGIGNEADDDTTSILGGRASAVCQPVAKVATGMETSTDAVSNSILRSCGTLIA